MNFARTWGLDAPIELRRREQVNDGNLMGALAVFGSPLGVSGARTGEAGITANVKHRLRFEVERTGANVAITVKLFTGSTLLDQVSVIDEAGVTSFDAIALRPAGPLQSAEEFTFSRIYVELEGEIAEPPPPRESPWAAIAPLDANGNKPGLGGVINDVHFPWVYHYGLPGWKYIYPEAELGSMFGYAYVFGGYQFWTADNAQGWHRIIDIDQWARFDQLPILDLFDRFRPQPTPADVIPQGERTLYVALSGSDSAGGSINAPLRTLGRAVAISQPGDVIVMRGGVYQHSSTISIGTSRSGTSSRPITVINYPGESVILDFSQQNRGSGNIGVRLDASNWRLIGLTIRNAGHNGLRVDGSNNRLERLVTHNNHDTGLHLAGNASHNLILNCDSYHNFNTTGRVGNNADGFGAKFTSLGPGNWFYGCRSWENSDDGFDFWEAPNPVRVENCWAFGNGDPSVFGFPANFEGAGNGFKLGGNFVAGNHIVIRSLAFDNLGTTRNAKGFDHNNNTGALTFIHNTAFNNGRNFVIPNVPVGGGQHVFYNNLSAPFITLVQIAPGSLQQGNSWQRGVVTDAMFRSLNTALAKSPRQPDGSLPVIDLLRPLAGSFLIDGGVDLGPQFPFFGAAPDIGAYELMPNP
ncbi:MAG: right-handed parallel beta-helix repeat-containing protein [Verrucomicrobia bacterium]|nr:right-handed parallel beta-helix repeat-containing protein [Verrucomicrobiota bacterium]